MSKKKPPTTIEECNAEMELTQKKIRQYENRNKMLDRKLAIEKRKDSNYRYVRQDENHKCGNQHFQDFAAVCQLHDPACQSHEEEQPRQQIRQDRGEGREEDAHPLCQNQQQKQREKGKFQHRFQHSHRGHLLIQKSAQS